MERSKKEQVVAELQEKLKDVTMAVLADYSGLNVATITELRNELRKSNAELRVVKNTLFRLAVGLEETDDIIADLEKGFEKAKR